MIAYHEILAALRGEQVQNPHAQFWGERLSGNPEQEISGSVPVTFLGFGETLTNYRIYGNTVQNGTPSPEAPVDVVGCGVRTGNLFDISTAVLGKYINAQGVETNSTAPTPIGALNRTDYIEIQPNTDYTYHYKYGAGVNNTIALCWFDANKNLISRNTKDLSYAEKEYTLTGTSPANAAFCIINFAGYLPNESMKLSFNTGSTDLPYEPYGYKIPVTVSNGANYVTTPIYIGTEPLHKIGDYADYVDYKRGVVVRNIKKIALTGDENWSNEVKNENQNVYKIENFANFRSFSNIGICRCTHILYMYPPYPSDLFDRIVLLNVSIYPYTLYFSTKKIMGFNTLESFKTFLAAQYEAGTPVTIWYVLAEPEEEPMENLLPIQTIKGTNSLTADTTVQPSEMYLKGKIKPVT